MDALDEKPPIALNHSNASFYELEEKREEEQLDSGHTEKEMEIREACKWKDPDRLRRLAETKGGLLNDELRQQACKVSKDRSCAVLRAC